jgi:hypothetical protein
MSTLTHLRKLDAFADARWSAGWRWFVCGRDLTTAAPCNFESADFREGYLTAKRMLDNPALADRLMASYLDEVS